MCGRRTRRDAADHDPPGRVRRRLLGGSTATDPPSTAAVPRRFDLVLPSIPGTAFRRPAVLTVWDPPPALAGAADAPPRLHPFVARARRRCAISAAMGRRSEGLSFIHMNLWLTRWASRCAEARGRDASEALARSVDRLRYSCSRHATQRSATAVYAPVALASVYSTTPPTATTGPGPSRRAITCNLTRDHLLATSRCRSAGTELPARRTGIDAPRRPRRPAAPDLRSGRLHSPRRDLRVRAAGFGVYRACTSTRSPAATSPRGEARNCRDRDRQHSGRCAGIDREAGRCRSPPAACARAATGDPQRPVRPAFRRRHVTLASGRSRSPLSTPPPAAPSRGKVEAIASATAAGPWSTTTRTSAIAHRPTVCQ